jgi:hypothetical protein
MEPSQQSKLIEQLNFNVVLLQDVPVTLRTSMVKISE